MRTVPRSPLGPANRVTLLRAALVGVVTGLVVRGTRREAPAGPLLCLVVPALVLDAVDGWVARRTDSVTAFGARLDGEVDAVLILALSIHLSRHHRAWVLPVGLARYAFAAAGWRWPWMRRGLPPRYWRKVATATEGIALAAALAPRLPRRFTATGLAVGSALIAESFGRDVLWLWHRRHDAMAP